jgi:Resolvase, N terminal domain
MTVKCAIWCRVSKSEQETANQLEELRQWAERKGFEVTREYVFEVSASSGAAKHKEMLAEALTDARPPGLSRLGRQRLDRVLEPPLHLHLVTRAREAALRRCFGDQLVVGQVLEATRAGDGLRTVGGCLPRVLPLARTNLDAPPLLNAHGVILAPGRTFPGDTTGHLHGSVV